MLKRIALASIKAYQATNGWRSQTCRFYPSCSNYAWQSIEKHGLLVGILLTVIRLTRCQPIFPGGVDDVPAEFDLEYVKKRFWGGGLNREF